VSSGATSEYYSAGNSRYSVLNNLYPPRHHDAIYAKKNAVLTRKTTIPMMTTVKAVITFG
jgi:hypothetical protein